MDYQFGTVYADSNRELAYPDGINNVMDAFSALSDLVKRPELIEINNTRYQHFKKLGELHIYGNKPIVWISHKIKSPQ
jgi:hypothetical protein